jgi:alkylhydroperoxidase family enzyme
MSRIPPVPRDRWSDAMRDALAAMRPPVPRYHPAGREDRPQAGNTLDTFAHHPALAQAFLTFNGHILYATTLTERQREILVLRVAVLRESAYLWAQHVFLGRDAGLTDEEMGRIAFGPEAPFFEPLETALIRCVDELVDDGAIGAETWAVLAAELDAQQLLDVVFTVGCYNTVAWMFRSFDLEVDPEIPDMLRRERPAPG